MADKDLRDVICIIVVICTISRGTRAEIPIPVFMIWPTRRDFRDMTYVM